MIVARPRAVAEIPYVEARHYTRGRKRPFSQGVCIHCTDGGEGVRKAEDVAVMFHKGWDAPKDWRSAHEVQDTDSLVRCVPLDCRAYHCGKEGNDRLIGLEFCGRASQTREQWLDKDSLPMLELGAYRVAELCHEFHWPIYYVDYTGLLKGAKGVTTHLDVKRAWHQTTHSDPGPGFPMDEFLEAARGVRL